MRVQAQHGIWGQLEAGGGKEDILKRRNESVDRAHARLEAGRKQRLERKLKEERCVAPSLLVTVLVVCSQFMDTTPPAMSDLRP